MAEPALKDEQPAKIKDACRVCRFYWPTPKGGRGDCHRFPPPGNVNGFPNVGPLEWCGEFQLDAAKRDALVKKLAAEDAAAKEKPKQEK